MDGRTGEHESQRALAVAASFLAEMSEDARDGLLRSAIDIVVPAGQVCFKASDRPARGAIVVSGLMRTFVEAADGRRMTIRHVRAGGLAGLLTGLAVERAPIYVQAVTDCVLLELPMKAIRDHAIASPGFAWMVARETSLALLDATEVLARSTFGTNRERLARCLLDMAHPGPSGHLVVGATHQELADSIGTVREVVSRVLRDLRTDGLVSTNAGQIILERPVGLAALAGGWQARSR